MELGLIIALIVLIFSVIAHEVAHGYAADALGDPTARLAGRLTLNPLPHIDPLGSVIIPALLVFTQSPIFFGWAKPVPYNPHNLENKRWGEAIVAVAGSATNLLLALIFGLIVRFGSALPEEALVIAALVTHINLFLGFFNLIPFPPLDGFTTLRAALPWHLARPLEAFEMRMREQGATTLILFLLIFYYLLAAPFVWLVQGVFQALTGGV